MKNEVPSFRVVPPSFELPQYKNDCELIDICAELGATYKICHKGANLLSERCTPAQKQSILQGHNQRTLQLEIQDREDKRQADEEKLQFLRDKKAVRRSWFQLLIAAILGGFFTKLIDWIPTLIDLLKALLK